MSTLVKISTNSLYVYAGDNNIRVRSTSGFLIGQTIVIWDGGYDVAPPTSVRTIIGITVDGDFSVLALDMPPETGSGVVGRCAVQPQAGDGVVFFPTKGSPVQRTVIRAVDPALENQGLIEIEIDALISLEARVGRYITTSSLAATFSATGLPTGVSIAPYTGIISGTPTTAGAYPVTVTTTGGIITSNSFVIRIWPTAPDAAFSWSSPSTEAWMNTISTMEPRVREAYRVGMPYDVGRPALAPQGLSVKPSGTVEAAYVAENSIPRIVAFQPWMLDCGIYVAENNFWNPKLL